MARRRRPVFRPLDLYQHYPQSDLLNIDIPNPLTTWDEFHAGAVVCGDTLVQFLANELGESGVPLIELAGRLNIALADIDAVRTAIQGMTRQWT